MAFVKEELNIMMIIKYPTKSMCSISLTKLALPKFTKSVTLILN